MYYVLVRQDKLNLPYKGIKTVLGSIHTAFAASGGICPKLTYIVNDTHRLLC